MRIIIGGGTGFIGRQLVPKLISEGYRITVIGRSKEKIKRIFSDTVDAITWSDLSSKNPDDFDAIINLAGEGIAESRWSDQVKDALISSRIESTTQFVKWCNLTNTNKPHFYNASAIGIYGLQATLPANKSGFCEDDDGIASKTNDFARELVKQWESAALKASDANKPVTLMRFGVVLRRGEAMLKKLEMPAKFGMGATIGSGLQPLSWIDSVDLINAISFLLHHPEITGPVNLVAPEIVTQKEFTAIFAQSINRPALLWLPAFAVKFLFGQMGEELLLSGQAVEPRRLQEHHFEFKFPTLRSALEYEFSDRRG